MKSVSAYQVRRVITSHLEHRIEKGLVPDHRSVTRSADRTRLQLRDVPLQAVVRRNADGALHAPFF